MGKSKHKPVTAQIWHQIIDCTWWAFQVISSNVSYLKGVYTPQKIAKGDFTTYSRAIFLFSIVILICQSSDPFFTSLHFKLFGFLWILQDCYIQVGSIWAVFLPCCCLFLSSWPTEIVVLQVLCTKCKVACKIYILG